ncbi:MAG: hypothetical protein O7E51_03120 [Acidobacteria bacterium]|nr:hypothetical protein [Acidobacteriota bacterium]
MQNHFMGSILAVAAALAVAPLLLAQTAQQSGAGMARTAAPKADLSGVWLWASENEGGGSRRRFSLEEPPLQPWAMEIYKTNRAGLTDPRASGLDVLDPFNYCMPPGVPRNMLGSTSPFEIIQLPNRVVILDEMSNATRQIFLDGREHPEGWPFGWMGHSIGKWDGDTLVVDTVGRYDKTWLDHVGTPHSDALHVVERFRLVDRDTLEVEFLFDDPKAFTKPWGAKRLYQLRPDLEIVEKVMCEQYFEIGKYLGREEGSLDPDQ